MDLANELLFLGKAGEISTYSRYQQREKRSKKEKFTTTILIFLQRTTMIITGTVRVITYTLLKYRADKRNYYI